VSPSQTSTRGGGVDLPTLVVTAVASAAAAYVTSQIWAPGTLAAAAFTPVLVALLKEMLVKPVEVVTRAVPVRGVVRSASSTGEPADAPHEKPEAIEARIAQLGEAPGSSRPGRARRNWQLAVITGLLGFIIAAVIITVPELVAGSSASGGGRDTTFFGGEKGASSAPTDTTTTTTTTPDETETVPPASTVTVPPPAETITVPPPSPTPVPEEQTPPPDEAPPEVPATPPAPPPPPG
jgi:hypothetical protein